MFGEGNIAAYADDILIMKKVNFRIEEIQSIASIALKYGLQVNKDKCQKVDLDSTEELTFAGIPIRVNGRTDRVKEVTDKYIKELNDLMGLNIPL